MKFSSMVRLGTLVIGLSITACADDGDGLAVPQAPAVAVTPEQHGEAHAGHDHGAHAQHASGMSADAQVLMLAPQDGEIVRGPLQDGRVAVAVEMGLAAARLAPAGQMEHGTGHHHVIVDAGPLPAGEPVPFDEQHLHYGQGQTRTEVQLAPGAHRLTLQFADGAHRSYGPQLAASVDIWVEAE